MAETDQGNPRIRIAFAEALSEELDMDMTAEFVAACDRLLMRLWMKDLQVVGTGVGPKP